ncbi:hypothetical protein BYT27DRAFT_6402965 [Phlegmacium glaucopus]|nr:hypothetical protein BYT27DRAFT_6402965 [Phlegmacium glaucopus]
MNTPTFQATKEFNNPAARDPWSYSYRSLFSASRIFRSFTRGNMSFTYPLIDLSHFYLFLIHYYSRMITFGVKWLSVYFSSPLDTKQRFHFVYL